MHLPLAISDMLEIEEYLAQHSTNAADRFVDDLGERTAALLEYPFMNPIYEDDPFFRRMVLGDYLLFYNVDEKRKLVIIHRIFHHSKDINRRILVYKKQ